MSGIYIQTCLVFYFQKLRMTEMSIDDKRMYVQTEITRSLPDTGVFDIPLCQNAHTHIQYPTTQAWIREHDETCRTHDRTNIFKEELIYKTHVQNMGV